MRAREERGHWLAEDALSVADAPVRLGKDGRMDAAAVNKQRLPVDIRKWFAAKLFPKVYGDRVATEVSGPEGAPVPIVLTATDWDVLISKVTGQATTVPEAGGGCPE